MLSARVTASGVRRGARLAWEVWWSLLGTCPGRSLGYGPGGGGTGDHIWLYVIRVELVWRGAYGGIRVVGWCEEMFEEEWWVDGCGRDAARKGVGRGLII